MNRLRTQSLVVLFLASALAVSRAAVITDAPPAQRARAAAGSAEQADPELEAQLQEIAGNLRCPTCRALSIKDSPSGMAQEMRDLIRAQLRQGMTAEEIYAYFVDRYGEWILLKPKATGFNWTVWLLPIVLLAAGLLFVLTTARRWVRRGQEREAALADGPE